MQAFYACLDTVEAPKVVPGMEVAPSLIRKSPAKLGLSEHGTLALMEPIKELLLWQKYEEL